MIEFYATLAYGHTRQYMPGDVSYLIPASSWYGGVRRDGSLPPPNLPAHIQHVAADSGGFVAARKWGGKYRYSPQQYVDWLNSFQPEWAATMDFCCEPPIARNRKVIYQRQDSTTRAAWHFWTHYRDVRWAWVPTIQGWEVADYVRHARAMKPLIAEMQQHYRENPHWRVGIGTLCARASNAMILQVVGAVVNELPGVKLHLWGVKLNFLKTGTIYPQIMSVDSAAWDACGLGRDGCRAREERKRLGLSQAEHKYQLSLPRYLEKFSRAVNQPKQLIML